MNWYYDLNLDRTYTAYCNYGNHFLNTCSAKSVQQITQADYQKEYHTMNCTDSGASGPIYSGATGALQAEKICSENIITYPNGVKKDFSRTLYFDCYTLTSGPRGG